MGEVYLPAITIFAVCTLVLSIIVLRRLNRLLPSAPLSKEIVTQLLRAETDLVNKHADDQARGIREELALNLKSFQDSTVKAFSALNEIVGTQTRMFGDRLELGIKLIDGKVAGIGDKLNTDLAKMGDEAGRNRDALRRAIEER